MNLTRPSRADLLPAGELPGHQSKRRPLRGFTLIELLTVIAIMGVLAGILIPTTMMVRVSAKRAKTKVLFSQWAGAMELFRQEYGYYPAIDDGRGKVDWRLFAAALTGRSLAGTEAESGELGGNAKRAVFYSIVEADLNETRTALVDAFGNSDIAVLYDRNGDGRLTADDGAVRAVTGSGGGAFSPAVSDLNLSAGLRAGVIFYSAGNGTGAGDLILSWK
jgi:prepilin-type N-terminal cleavage/methylation domain-containing protein